MFAVPFDTLKYSETLKEAGIPEEQAKALTTGLAEAVDMALATKQDIKDVRGEIKDVRGEIKDLRKDMQVMQKDLIFKLGTICVVAIGVSVTLMEFLRP